jgi:hypothetical protein
MPSHAQEIQDPHQQVLTIPVSVGALDLIDLDIELKVPGGLQGDLLVLGAIEQDKILVWQVLANGPTKMIHFQASTGDLLFQQNVPSEAIEGAQPSRTSTRLVGGGRVAVLGPQEVRMIGLGGELLEVFELPFKSSDILGASSEALFISSAQTPEPDSPTFFRLDLATGQVQGAPESGPDSRGFGHNAPAFVLSGEIGLWAVSGSEVYVENLNAESLASERKLQGHPMAQRYLQGAYDHFQITNAHLIDGRFLWLFIRLGLRDPHFSPAQTDVERFRAAYDGLVEVIDLPRWTLVASGYLPDLGGNLAGWIGNSIGYRRDEDGRVFMLHCGFLEGQKGVS